MANIDLTFELYPSNTRTPAIPAIKATENVKVTMSLSKLELARHSMCLGYMDLKEFASRRIERHISRFCQVLADVDVDPAVNRLVLSQDYDHCDPSEKRYGSYTLGESLTRAVANHYFDVRWVCHFDTLVKRHGYKKVTSAVAKPNADPSAGGSTPDLVGYDSEGKAHLFEAKGTKGLKTSESDAKKAVNQVSSFEAIEHNGQVDHFVTRNACCFSYKGGFKGRIIDPYSEGSYSDNSGLYGCLFDNYALFFNFFEQIDSEPIRVDSASFLALPIKGRDGKTYLFGIDSDYMYYASEMGFDEYAEQLKYRSRDEARRAMFNNRSGHYKMLAKHFAESVSDKRSLYKSEKIYEQIIDLEEYKDCSIGDDGFIVIECL